MGAVGLLTAGCFSSETLIAVHEDWSTNISGVVVFDAEADLAALDRYLAEAPATAGVTTCERLSESAALPLTARVEAFPDEDACELRYEVPIAPALFSSVLDKAGVGGAFDLSGFSGSGSGEWNFGARLGSETIDEDDLLAGLLIEDVTGDAEITLALRLPGAMAEQNATYVDFDDVAVWELGPVVEPTEIHARSELVPPRPPAPGQDRTPLWLGLTSATILAAVYFGARWLVRRRRRERDDMIAAVLDRHHRR